MTDSVSEALPLKNNERQESPSLVSARDLPIILAEDEFAVVLG